MSGRSGDRWRGAMKTVGFCLLSVLLALADGAITNALGASGPPPPRTPLLPSSAATLPSPDTPAGGAARDIAPDSPRNPNSRPIPAPAPTDHFAGSAEDSSG